MLTKASANLALKKSPTKGLTGTHKNSKGLLNEASEKNTVLSMAYSAPHTRKEKGACFSVAGFQSSAQAFCAIRADSACLIRNRPRTEI